MRGFDVSQAVPHPINTRFPPLAREKTPLRSLFGLSFEFHSTRREWLFLNAMQLRSVANSSMSANASRE